MKGKTIRTTSKRVINRAPPQGRGTRDADYKARVLAYENTFELQKITAKKHGKVLFVGLFLVYHQGMNPQFLKCCRVSIHTHRSQFGKDPSNLPRLSVRVRGMSLQGAVQEVATLKQVAPSLPVCDRVNTDSQAPSPGHQAGTGQAPLPSHPLGAAAAAKTEGWHGRNTSHSSAAWLLTPSKHQQVCLSFCFIRKDSDLGQMKRLWLKPI